MQTHANLLCAGDGTKDNLCKASLFEGSIGDTTDNLETSLHNRHAPMIPVKDKTSNIFARHLW